MPVTETEVEVEVVEKSVEEQKFQSVYQPRSKGNAIGTLAPVGIAAGMALSLDRVEQVTGLDVDTYVAAKLGCSYETLFDRYAAEQIDTQAISFLNEELGLQSTITHDTGIGKGRIVSALVQRAIAPIEMPDLVGKTQEEQAEILAGLGAEIEASAAQGRIAVFVTAKPDLYVDMLARDMVDTGVASLVRPFFTNSGLDVELKSPDGTVTGYVRTPGTAAQNREMESLIQQFQTTGTLGNYNVVFTTYDQLKDKNSVRRRFFEEIAPATTFVLDECDLAGGASGEVPELTGKQKLAQAQGLDIRTVSEYVCGSLMPKAKAYVNLSATAAKDPYVLSRLIYSQSDIQNVGLGAETLAKTLSDQGVPAQQDAANRLAAGGELQRLEKDMSGVGFGTTQISVDLNLFQQSVGAMQRVVDFDRLKQETVKDMKEGLYAQAKAIRSADPSAGEASITSTAFTSSAYNLTQQLLFALKADGIADDAIAAIENGQKPKIDFYNTMQSMLESYLDDRKDEFYQVAFERIRTEEIDKIIAVDPQAPQSEIDQAFLTQFAKKIMVEGALAYREWFATNPDINMNFGDLLIRQMERCRMVTIGDPYGEKTRYRLTDEELGLEAVELFETITQEIRAADWTGLPISPVDAILHKIESAGYTIGEMSGRSIGLDYSTPVPTLKSVDASDPKVRSDVKSGFNNGSIDAIATNITTGWSAHAQVGKVKDLRQRVNIVAQPHSNPNMLIQSLGRVNRTGQLDPSKHPPERMEADRAVWGEVIERYDIEGKFGLPVVRIVQAEGVPYERRVIANINRKFASLNANTTGNRQAGTDFGGVDFNNAIGDRIVEGILEDFPRLDNALDYPLANMESTAGAANKVTGRSIFLKLEDQELLMNLIETRFTEEILQLEALGESPLEQKTFDLQSTTLERLKLLEAKSDGIFGGAVYVEKMRVRALRKPFTAEQVAEQVQKYTETDEPVSSKDLRENSNLRQSAEEKMQEQLEVVGIRVNSILEGQEAEISQLQEATQDSAFVAARAKAVKESVESLKAEQVELKNEIKALSGKESPLSNEEKVVEKVRLKQILSEKQSELETQSTLYKELTTKVAKLSGLMTQQQKLVETNQKIKAGWTGVQAKLSLCTPGQAVSLSTGEGLLYGVVTDVQRVEAVQNPIAGGAWKVKVAIADAAREITLKLGDIALNSIEKHEKQIKVQAADDQCYMFMPGGVLKGEVRELLDALQKESYEIRQIATGELLNAPVKGKFLKFTTAEGQIRQGILLPRGVDIENELERQAVPVQTDQVQTLLIRNIPMSTRGGMSLTSASRRRSGQIEDGVFLEVKATKGEGGDYFTNKDLIAFTKNNEGEPGFEQAGSGKNRIMRGFVLNADVPALLQWLTDKKESLSVVKLDQLASARAVLKQTLQKFEEVTEPAASTEVEITDFQIPVEKLRDRIAQVQAQRDVQDSLRVETMRVALESRVNDDSLFDEAFSVESVKQLLDGFNFESVEQILDRPPAENTINSDAAITGLTEAYRKNFTEGSTFSDIRQARKFAKEYLADQQFTGELTNKTIEECIEKSIVLASSDIARSKGDRLESFDSLVELYQSMPRLQSRTSNSVILQQYSTPVPLGLLAQQLAGVDGDTIVYEPTIGNGSLVTNANPKNVEGNEIDPKRATFARSQGYGVSQQDATEYAPPRKVDVVIANPPFGKTDDLEGNTKKFLIDLPNPAEGTRAYATPKMDHAISFKALTALKEEGKAVLILGAPMEQKMNANASDAYNGPDNRAFYHTLYNNYNVTQHFTVSGDLYAKQGTSFPVDVVVIEGRGRSELPLPAAQTPVVYRTWESLREVMKQSIEQGLEQRESLEALLDTRTEFTVEREGLSVDVYLIQDGSGYGASFKPTPESNPITSFQGISKEDAIEWANNTLNVAEISESYKKQAQPFREDSSMAEAEVNEQSNDVLIGTSLKRQAEIIPPALVQEKVINGVTFQFAPVVVARSEIRGVPSEVKSPMKSDAGNPKNLKEKDLAVLKKTGLTPAAHQTGKAERNVANLLHKSGIAAAGLMSGEDFSIKIENDPYTPLSVERHDNQIYLTHYQEIQGELVLDAEMVFTVTEGDLKLTETAVQNPIRGGESRGCDRKFAELYSKNILAQGFVEAAQKTLAAQSVEAPKPVVEAVPVKPKPVVEPKITEPKPVVAAQPKPTVAPTVQVANVIQQADPTVSPQSLKALRNWTADEQINKLQRRINSLDSGGLGDFSRDEVKDAAKLLSDNKGLSLGQEYLRELDKMPDAVLLVEMMDRAQSIREGVTLRDIQSDKKGAAVPLPAVPAPAVSPMEATRQVIAKHDPETLKVMQQADPQAYSPSLKELRNWLSNAKTLGRDPAYQERIKTIGNDLLKNTPEQEKPTSERNPDHRNPDFSLSTKAQVAMARDNAQARDTEIAQIGAKILEKIGKPVDGKITFERPSGNYKLEFDSAKNTLNIWAKNQDNALILSQVNGKIQHESSQTTDVDRQTFKAFLGAVEAAKQKSSAAR